MTLLYLMTILSLMTLLLRFLFMFSVKREKGSNSHKSTKSPNGSPRAQAIEPRPRPANGACSVVWEVTEFYFVGLTGIMGSKGNG
jgi:uncharacterized membrane protein